MKLTLIAFVLSLVLLGCAPSNNQNPTNPNQPDPELQVITLEELATFDGRDGRPAYVAVDGVVYDVGDVRQWANGHQGLQPGADHSDAIGRSPHGRSVLRRLPIVGRLE